MTVGEKIAPLFTVISANTLEPAPVMLVVPPAKVALAVEVKFPVPVKFPVMEKLAFAFSTPGVPVLLMFKVVMLNTPVVVNVAAERTTTGPSCVVPAPVNEGVVPPKVVMPVEVAKFTVPVLSRVPSILQATVPEADSELVTVTLLKVFVPVPERTDVP